MLPTVPSQRMMLIFWNFPHTLPLALNQRKTPPNQSRRVYGLTWLIGVLHALAVDAWRVSYSMQHGRVVPLYHSFANSVCCDRLACALRKKMCRAVQGLT
jgi:hypothetical protein